MLLARLRIEIHLPPLAVMAGRVGAEAASVCLPFDPPVAHGAGMVAPGAVVVHEVGLFVRRHGAQAGETVAHPRPPDARAVKHRQGRPMAATAAVLQRGGSRLGDRFWREQPDLEDPGPGERRCTADRQQGDTRVPGSERCLRPDRGYCVVIAPPLRPRSLPSRNRARRPCDTRCRPGDSAAAGERASRPPQACRRSPCGPGRDSHGRSARNSRS